MRVFLAAKLMAVFFLVLSILVALIASALPFVVNSPDSAETSVVSILLNWN